MSMNHYSHAGLNERIGNVMRPEVLVHGKVIRLVQIVPCPIMARNGHVLPWDTFLPYHRAPVVVSMSDPS